MADDGKPDNITLSEVITGKGADIFWIPQCRSDEQYEAKAALSIALHGFERVFGLDATVQQIALWSATAQMIARKNAAQERILAARADINSEADRLDRQGMHLEARNMRARPTPDYPEKASDEAELGYAV